MERIDEFVVDRIIDNSNPIRNLFDENGYSREFWTIKSQSNLDDIKDELIDSILDMVMNYLSDISELTHDEGLDEWFEGGDEWVFEKGEYCWEYHEFEGWFYYNSPEGEINGLHKVGDVIIL